MSITPEELRAIADFYRNTDGTDCGLGEKLRLLADEIERLRAALERIGKGLGHHQYQCSDIAREALKDVKWHRFL